MGRASRELPHDEAPPQGHLLARRGRPRRRVGLPRHLPLSCAQEPDRTRRYWSHGARRERTTARQMRFERRRGSRICPSMRSAGSCVQRSRCGDARSRCGDARSRCGDARSRSRGARCRGPLCISPVRRGCISPVRRGCIRPVRRGCKGCSRPVRRGCSPVGPWSAAEPHELACCRYGPRCHAVTWLACCRYGPRCHVVTCRCSSQPT